VSLEAEEKAKEIKKLYEQVRAPIEKLNEQYKLKANKNRIHLEIKLGDLVWLQLRKERFSSMRKHKLMVRRDGPCKVVQKVEENAYRIELLGDMQISATVNVGDLTSYLKDYKRHNEYLREILFKGKRLMRSKLQAWTYSHKQGSSTKWGQR